LDDAREAKKDEACDALRRLGLLDQLAQRMMRIVICLVLVLLLIPLSTSADSELEIETGGIDLLKSEALARPYTVFDHLLYSLDKEVNEAAKNLRPEKNDFRPSKYANDSARVTYEKEVSRVGVLFEKTISGMDDPWRKVCERHVRRMARDLGVSGLGSEQALVPEEGLVRTFFKRHLGPTVFRDRSMAPFQAFLDALVVIGQFKVEPADRKRVAHLFSCALNIKNDHMTYFEHKY
jgi:hypothetical protein